ncbi:MAG: hypothetical protein IKO11_05115 [Lachnospiraceae bacterium]|nr:hypothetical protein [Lachnospiraceae bacterium]
MQMTMTERDKKLIVMISIIVIVVAIGWWGIRPALKAVGEAKEEIEEEEELKEMNDMKVARIPFFQEQIESNHAKIDELKTGFFPLMNSDQIDKKFTGLVLERGLFAFDLDIRMDRSPLAMSPYRYSKLASNPYLINETDGEDGEEGSGLEADYEEDLSGINDRVYKAHISFRIGGNKDALMRLIDDLAAYEPMLLITGYRWTESSYVEPYEPGTTEEEGEPMLTEGTELLPAANPNAEIADADTDEELPEGAHVEEDAGGKYLVVVREVLELDLDIYMYDDSESAEN